MNPKSMTFLLPSIRYIILYAISLRVNNVLITAVQWSFFRGKLSAKRLMVIPHR